MKLVLTGNKNFSYTRGVVCTQFYPAIFRLKKNGLEKSYAEPSKGRRSSRKKFCEVKLNTSYL